MKPRKIRLCVYPKDVQCITGRSERHSRHILHSIRAALKKPRHQAVTVNELGAWLGIPADAIREMLD